MSIFKKMGTTYAADCVTGERMNKDDRVLDTGYDVRDSIWLRKTRTRFIKEATLVELVEKAGWTITGRGDAKPDKPSVSVPEPTPRMVNEDAGVGDGTTETGETPLGGKPAAKRRSAGTPKSK